MESFRLRPTQHRGHASDLFAALGICCGLALCMAGSGCGPGEPDRGDAEDVTKASSIETDSPQSAGFHPARQEWESAVTGEEQLQILAAHSDWDSFAGREFLAEAVKSSDSEVQRLALGMLAEAERRDGISSRAAEFALGQQDASVRALAIPLLDPAGDSGLWRRALGDSAESVRVEAEWGLENASPDIRVGVSVGALATEDPELRHTAAQILGGVSSKPAVQALIPLLADPQLAEPARDGLFFLLGEHFSSRETAERWFRQAEPHLAEDLQPLDSFWDRAQSP